MDLLDLELDLNVDEATSSPTRVTRRSQSNVTPKVISKPPKKPSINASKTPQVKGGATPKSVSTPKSTATPKSAPKPTVTKTPSPVEKNVEKTAVKAAVKSSTKRPADTPTIEIATSSANEGASTSESAARGRSRSPSLEKRSRNKAKKRFSPSPVTKKRKSIVTSTPGASAAKKKVIRSDSQEEFAESLRELGVTFSQNPPVDFDIPNEWKSPKPSETVEKIISQLTGKSSNGSENQPATSAHTPVIV